MVKITKSNEPKYEIGQPLYRVFSDGYKDIEIHLHKVQNISGRLVFIGGVNVREGYAPSYNENRAAAYFSKTPEEAIEKYISKERSECKAACKVARELRSVHIGEAIKLRRKI